LMPRSGWEWAGSARRVSDLTQKIEADGPRGSALKNIWAKGAGIDWPNGSAGSTHAMNKFECKYSFKRFSRICDVLCFVYCITVLYLSITRITSAISVPRRASLIHTNLLMLLLNVFSMYMYNLHPKELAWKGGFVD
jgi:hypothetical protein